MTDFNCNQINESCTLYWELKFLKLTHENFNMMLDYLKFCTQSCKNSNPSLNTNFNNSLDLNNLINLINLLKIKLDVLKSLIFSFENVSELINNSSWEILNQELKIKISNEKINLVKNCLNLYSRIDNEFIDLDITQSNFDAKTTKFELLKIDAKTMEVGVKFNKLYYTGIINLEKNKEFRKIKTCLKCGTEFNSFNKTSNCSNCIENPNSSICNKMAMLGCNIS